MSSAKSYTMIFMPSLQKKKCLRFAWTILAVLAWGVSLIAVLQLYKLEGRFGHAICGAWGCGPPVEALLAYHGFWAILLWPIAAVAATRLRPGVARALGTGLLSAGIFAIVGILLWSSIDWLMTAETRLKPLVMQRALFVLATTIDVPSVQMAIAGLICRFVHRPCATHTPDDPQPPLCATAEENRAGQ